MSSGDVKRKKGTESIHRREAEAGMDWGLGRDNYTQLALVLYSDRINYNAFVLKSTAQLKDIVIGLADLMDLGR